MLVFLGVTIIILGFLSFHFQVSIDGHLDMFENDGYFAAKLVGVQLYRADIKLQSEDLTHNNIILKSGKHETEIHLNADKKDKQSIVRVMSHPLLENLMIKRLDIDVRVGKHNDAFFTTMMAGGIRAMLCSVLAFIKSRYNAKINETFTPEYNQDKFEADYFGIISISIADIIYSFVTTKVYKKMF